MKKIVHLWHAEKFTKASIQFVNQNFSSKDHINYVYGYAEKFNVPHTENSIFIKNITSVLLMIRDMNRTEKIILHGVLTDRDFILLLFVMPWLLKKCYWVIWGTDLYRYLDIPSSKSLKDKLKQKIKLFTKNYIYKRFGHIVTYIHGDVELARQWYGAKGIYHECIMYPSNIYQEINLPPKNGNQLCVMVGHSAVRANLHLEVFEKLKIVQDQDFKIYCPLSYGDKVYVQEVVNKGKEYFGARFVPLIDFLPIDQYLTILGEVDIAIFAAHQQMALGNMISLIGLGKKVYLRSDISTWKLFQSKNIKVFDVESLNVNVLDEEIAQKNKKAIISYFSHDVLKKQWKEIFEG